MSNLSPLALQLNNMFRQYGAEAVAKWVLEREEKAAAESRELSRQELEPAARRLGVSGAGAETMTNHPRRAQVAAARKVAQAAGYYICRGTTDDRLGRWYIGHNSDRFFRPYGAGYATQGEAWLAIADEWLAAVARGNGKPG